MIIVSELATMTSKYKALLGDGTTTVFTITQATHKLAKNGNMIAQVFQVSTGQKVEPDINMNDSNGTVTITFSVAPTTNQFRLILMS